MPTPDLTGATLPPDSESFGQGASRIRALKGVLNTLLGVIFSDATGGNFQTNAVPGSLLQNGSVQAAQLAATGVAAGSYDLVTVNAQGQVTAGARGQSLIVNPTGGGMPYTYTVDWTQSAIFYLPLGINVSGNITMANVIEGKSIAVLIENIGGGNLIGFTDFMVWRGGLPIPNSTSMGWYDLYTFTKINGLIFATASLGFHT